MILLTKYIYDIYKQGEFIMLTVFIKSLLVFAFLLSSVNVSASCLQETEEVLSNYKMNVDFQCSVSGNDVDKECVKGYLEDISKIAKDYFKLCERSTNVDDLKGNSIASN